MKPIVWNEKQYTVGNKIMDEQHEKIVGMINKLIGDICLNVHSEVLHDTLAEMLQYAQEHLSYEEELLERMGYEVLDNHKSHHWSYLEMVSELSMDIMNNKKGSAKEVVTYLTHWWQNHILLEDMKYKPFMEKHMVDSI